VGMQESRAWHGRLVPKNGRFFRSRHYAGHTPCDEPGQSCSAKRRWTTQALTAQNVVRVWELGGEFSSAHLSKTAAKKYVSSVIKYKSDPKKRMCYSRPGLDAPNLRHAAEQSRGRPRKKNLGGRPARREEPIGAVFAPLATRVWLLASGCSCVGLVESQQRPDPLAAEIEHTPPVGASFRSFSD
jgi:hypothetical protein